MNYDYSGSPARKGGEDVTHRKYIRTERSVAMYDEEDLFIADLGENLSTEVVTMYLAEGSVFCFPPDRRGMVRGLHAGMSGWSETLHLADDPFDTFQSSTRAWRQVTRFDFKLLGKRGTVLRLSFSRGCRRSYRFTEDQVEEAKELHATIYDFLDA